MDAQEVLQREVLQKACDFLARREHSRKELCYKLLRTCKDESLVEELLNKLAEEGLQSDERFAENFVYHRVNNGKGPLKIQQELDERGVHQDIISAYLDSKNIDWLEVAEAVRTKKYGKAVPSRYSDKAIQSRFLYSRGFNSEVIKVLLKTD